jgi:hypothetical protein
MHTPRYANANSGKQCLTFPLHALHCVQVRVVEGRHLFRAGGSGAADPEAGDISDVFSRKKNAATAPGTTPGRPPPLLNAAVRVCVSCSGEHAFTEQCHDLLHPVWERTLEFQYDPTLQQPAPAPQPLSLTGWESDAAAVEMTAVVKPSAAAQRSSRPRSKNPFDENYREASPSPPPPARRSGSSSSSVALLPPAVAPRSNSSTYEQPSAASIGREQQQRARHCAVHLRVFSDSLVSKELLGEVVLDLTALVASAGTVLATDCIGWSSSTDNSSASTTAASQQQQLAVDTWVALRQGAGELRVQLLLRPDPAATAAAADPALALTSNAAAANSFSDSEEDSVLSPAFSASASRDAPGDVWGSGVDFSSVCESDSLQGDVVLNGGGSGKHSHSNSSADAATAAAAAAAVAADAAGPLLLLQKEEYKRSTGNSSSSKSTTAGAGGASHAATAGTSSSTSSRKQRSKHSSSSNANSSNSTSSSSSSKGRFLRRRPRPWEALERTAQQLYGAEGPRVSCPPWLTASLEEQLSAIEVQYSYSYATAYSQITASSAVVSSSAADASSGAVVADAVVAVNGSSGSSSSSNSSSVSSASPNLQQQQQQILLMPGAACPTAANGHTNSVMSCTTTDSPAYSGALLRGALYAALRDARQCEAWARQLVASPELREALREPPAFRALLPRHRGAGGKAGVRVHGRALASSQPAEVPLFDLVLAGIPTALLSAAEAATVAAGTAAYSGASSRVSGSGVSVSDAVFDVAEGEQQGGAWVGDSFAFAADDADEDHYAVGSISDSTASSSTAAAAGLSKSRRNSTIGSKSAEPLQGVRASISGVEVSRLLLDSTVVQCVHSLIVLQPFAIYEYIPSI